MAPVLGCTDDLTLLGRKPMNSSYINSWIFGFWAYRPGVEFPKEVWTTSDPRIIGFRDGWETANPSGFKKELDRRDGK